ncbi:DUF4245 domain-containing protein [Rhodococcus spongiicola]|uniref:DUF4245 domain-containing protein n=1 Tax=Rhodococcus spongiicola TaxID=2487352 RepID=A0A3S3BQC0_9NOCA|nr:DUF4245 domain-containing protein [Rhodococcus spongiicola]RVW06732.1 DUF4245 domain-containing protein [Rhodococcus spongiicola]
MPEKKPRILQNGRDMAWSLIPLVIASLVIAGIASQCSINLGGPKPGPIPSFDADAAFRYDARELGFPIRQPEIPDGWTSNSGSRSSVSGAREADTTTIGFITEAGRYIQLTQSTATEEALVPFIADGPRYATGAEQIGGRTWVVFGGDGGEAIWVSDFEDARILITGSAPAEDFTKLATAVGAVQPLQP